MLLSTLLAPTLRETPAEAELASHRLMLRAGLMRKVAAGIYTYLPIGHRVIGKVERIVREEMDRQGSQELRLPIIQPAELWEETGRWAEYGEEMWRVKDRHGRLFCLGPTHEEIITDLVRNEVRSYRQLPLILYQVQNKYRDEIRPRFGVMRAREFIMKDAYSFDRDEEGLRDTYARIYEAYTRIFTRCGLDYRAVEADSGAIGGSFTHEFMALADAGEAQLVFCDACGYAANAEKAEARPSPPSAEPPLARERVATPGVRSIAEVTAHLGVDAGRTVKTLFYWAVDRDGGNRLAGVLVRGDREVNEVKLRNRLGCLHLRMAAPEEVRELTGAPVGSAGPVGLGRPEGFRLLADPEVMAGRNLVTGANEEGFHYRHVNPGRDFEPDEVADLRLVGAGDGCPRCRETLKARRGIEVGQVFQLGTKYSRAMGAVYLDEQGAEREMVMGCYGIGVTRTVAAIIEQHADADGIRWPVSVAPYHVAVVPVNWQAADQRETALRVYGELRAAGVEVCLDDRDERAGVKFKDADLIGFPFRVTVGPRALAEGKVEVTIRDSGDTIMVPVDGVSPRVAGLLAEAMARLDPDYGD